MPENQTSQPSLLISVAVKAKRSGRPGRMLIGELPLSDDETEINGGMVRAIARAHKWNQEMLAGKLMSEIAKQEAVDRSDVSQILPLAFLAPDIAEAIIDGRHPTALKVEHILKPLPVSWPDQRTALGFPTAL
jgi:hypothetical protein